MRKFEQGLPAYIAANIDRLHTLFAFKESKEIRGLDPLKNGDSRIVFHLRDSGEYVSAQLPNGDIQVMNEADILHIYDGKWLVERKRLKDKPKGFEVFNSSTREMRGAINDRIVASERRSG